MPGRHTRCLSLATRLAPGGGSSACIAGAAGASAVDASDMSYPHKLSINVPINVPERMRCTVGAG